MDEPTLFNHLRALVDNRLVTATSAEAFEFRHALTREAVYSTLLKRQRVIYHGLVAAILEAQGSGEAAPGAARAADLAHHYREAGNWSKALEYAQLAGEQAQNQYAPREAAQHFSHALEAAAQLGQPPNLRLLRGRGQAYETLGEFEAARADYELGLSAARAAGAAPAEWQALLDLGFLWAGRDYARTGDYFQRALALARASGDPLAVAESLNRLGNWLVNTGQSETGLQRHFEALEIFNAQGSVAGMAATHDLLALTYAFAGNLPAAIQQVGQAIPLLRQTGNIRGLISSLGSRNSLVQVSDTLPWVAFTLPECRQTVAEAAGLAREIGWLAGLAEVQWAFSLTLAMFGQMGEALAWAQDALRTASDIDHRQWNTAGHFVIGYVHLLLLEPELAANQLKIARALADELGSTWWIGYSAAFLAFALLRLGRAPEAQATLESAAAAMSLETDWVAQTPRTLMGRYLLWAWGETALAAGQPAEALALAERLIDTAINPAGEPLPYQLKFKAEALSALGRPAEAWDALSQAAEGARQHGTQPILWQIEAARARLATAQRRPDDAQRAREAARAAIEYMANTLQSPAREGFRVRALSQLGD